MNTTFYSYRLEKATSKREGFEIFYDCLIDMKSAEKHNINLHLKDIVLHQEFLKFKPIIIVWFIIYTGCLYLLIFSPYAFISNKDPNIHLILFALPIIIVCSIILAYFTQNYDHTKYFLIHNIVSNIRTESEYYFCCHSSFLKKEIESKISEDKDLNLIKGRSLNIEIYIFDIDSPYQIQFKADKTLLKKPIINKTRINGFTVGTLLNKLISSVISAAGIFLIISFLIYTANGSQQGTIFTFIINNWLICLGFGVFITIGRIFEKDFWKAK
jgi:hypothetical protein